MAKSILTAEETLVAKSAIQAAVIMTHTASKEKLNSHSGFEAMDRAFLCGEMWAYVADHPAILSHPEAKRAAELARHFMGLVYEKASQIDEELNAEKA